MPNPFSVDVVAAAKAQASEYNNLRADALKGFPYLYNKSGGALAEGDVVIWDIANASSITTTTLEGHRRIAGVIMTGGANDAQVWLAPYGCVCTVKVTGTVPIGAALITSTTATRAIANGGSTQPGLLGYALTSNPSGNGTVSAIICPTYDKFGSNVTIVNDQTGGPVSGGTDVVAITSMSCSGTNRLLVVLLMDDSSSGSYTNVKYGGTTMTISQIGITSGTNKKVCLAYMVNPPAGSANVTFTMTTAGTRAQGICLDGVNQSTPVRTEGTATGTSTTPAVTPGSGQPGDFALGVVCSGHPTNTPSARGAGQVNLDTTQNINSAATGFCDYEEVIASTSEALTWTTPNSAAWAAAGILVVPL